MRLQITTQKLGAHIALDSIDQNYNNNNKKYFLYILIARMGKAHKTYTCVH